MTAGQVIAEKGRGPELAILLVEDEHYLRLAGQRLLGLIGYQVVTVADGQEALELLSSGDVEVDLVLSDVVMPNLSGKDLHKALQTLPDAPPILFTSGSSRSDLQGEHLLDPSLPLVSKPWDMTELAGKIHEVLALATGEAN